MNKLTLVATLGLAAALILGIAVSNESRAATIPVPNGDFETLYKPGTAITGVIAPGQWNQGVGPDCPLDNTAWVYEFSDATTGALADIPGWIGYDRQGWIDLGGTYGRDQTTGNLQGSVAAQGPLNGVHCYLGNGSDWGNQAGALIVSDAPVATVDSGLIYTLSMMTIGGATPVALELLADGVPLTPSSSISPPDAGEWREFSRTYDATSLSGHDGESLTIVLGHGRPATGTQNRYDDVSLTAIPEPSTLLLAAVGLLSLAWYGWRRR
jgi:hypothetical protein